jgi:hypothetical protein
VPPKTTGTTTPPDSDRLLVLQDALDALVSETRALRDRLELLLSERQLALQKLQLARRRTPRDTMKRANRVF